MSDGLLRGTEFASYYPVQAMPCEDGPLLTDDHAPVEWLVAKYIKKD